MGDAILRRAATLAALVLAGACAEANGPPRTEPPSPEAMLRDAVRFHQASRNDAGLYRDRLRFDGAHEGPASVATVGMGLISLCVGNRLGMEGNAAALAAATVRTMLGLAQARNASGFYYHFIDMETGDRAGNSEYSTIDTAILVSGALFAASCLSGDDALDSLAWALWDSVDWSRAIADPETGAIYLEMLDDGSGKAGSLTLPFNEYMLVAWLAAVADSTDAGPATALWERHYADADGLPTSSFDGVAVLTDRPGAFLSSFVVQVPYYLVHPFTTDERYRAFMGNAARADRAWWERSGATMAHEWGLGAGSSPSGYHADAVDDNPDLIVSPHVVAGFLPVDSGGIADLTAHYRAGGRAVRAVNGVDGRVLWRYSVSDPRWVPDEIQGIDYAAMMLGLAAHRFGRRFVETHNDVEAWLARSR